jgi:acetyl esterase/lipase/lysophospholipase L1-like esterase
MKYLSLFVFLAIANYVFAQTPRKVIQLYPGAAPGSENWTWNETYKYNNNLKEQIVINVSHPTLTVFPADPVIQATGTSVIICPGGGFTHLSIDNEGNYLAEWLSKKGITCFVLKYRLEHSDSSKDNKTSKIEYLPVVPLAIEDGKNAIAYVRSHAAEFHLKTDRIGIIGFSAGGTIAVTAASEYNDQNRPDFVAAIYPYLPSALQKPALENAPPLFIAAASDDRLNSDNQNVILYNKWLKAKDSVEIHIYKKGGHGFGMRKQNISADTWADRFSDWMEQLGLYKPITDEKTDAQKFKEGMAGLTKAYDDRLHNDWAWLKRFEDDNSKVPPPAPGEKRVVFLGNSITENWINQDPAFFKGRYINRGIGGQTTPQMLVRFREDVINLKPTVVIIEAGTNDIAENTGPSKLENVAGNIFSMAELAKANHIKVILSSVLPASAFPWHPGINPIPLIVKLNKMLSDYAKANNLGYIDYYSSVVDENKAFKKELTNDGFVHPNLAGYKIMEPLAEKGINEALSKK